MDRVCRSTPKTYWTPQSQSYAMQIWNYGEETIQPPSIMEEAENAIEKLNNKSPWVDNLQANY